MAQRKGEKKGNEEANEEENNTGKREVVREEERKLISRWCVNQLPRNNFEEFGHLEDSEGVSGSHGDSCGGSCAFSRCPCGADCDAWRG